MSQFLLKTEKEIMKNSEFSKEDVISLVILVELLDKLNLGNYDESIINKIFKNHGKNIRF